MQPVSSRRWRLKEPDNSVIETLMRENSLTALLARILANRNITDSNAANLYLSPTLAAISDPFQLLGMEKAASRLVKAWQSGERVCVYGDYDVDGITSVALLLRFFRAVGIDSEYIIPNRLEDGYGLSREGLEKSLRLGASVVISVDCGITSVDEAIYAKDIGIDLIITDHHTPSEIIPDAYSVINPLQHDCPSLYKAFAGVGLAFKLMIALRSRLREAGCFSGKSEPNLREYLDVVALGTVADLVPLTGENRIFVSHGLRELTVGSKVGIQALKKVAGVNDDVNTGSVGFRLAPRMNAAGRLDDAALGVELLLCDEPALADEIAQTLDAGNRERQELEKAILKDALNMVQDNPDMASRTSIVLASADWHPGVIGIVASRLVDIYHRPTILIALDEGHGKGSGRSIPSFHLHEALKACSDHLVKFGGHKQAAGLSINEDAFAEFVNKFDQIVAGLLAPEDLTPELAIDAELGAEEINSDLVAMLNQLAPFGMGNPEPLFLLRGCAVKACRELQGGHLRMSIRKDGINLIAIGFGMANRQIDAKIIDLVFSPQINEWRGERTVQLKIKDFRAAGTGDANC